MHLLVGWTKVWAPLTISENLQTVFGGVLGGESQVTKCDTRLGSMDDSCILNANSVAAYVKTQVAAYNFGAQTTSRELLENCLVFLIQQQLRLSGMLMQTDMITAVQRKVMIQTHVVL